MRVRTPARGRWSARPSLAFILALGFAFAFVLASPGCQKKDEPPMPSGPWWGIEGSVIDNATFAPLAGTHVSHRSASSGNMTAFAIADSSGRYEITVPGSSEGLSGDLLFDEPGYTPLVVHLPGYARLGREGRYQLDVVLSR